ncbi:DUF2061 domain-containing protein [Vibrio sp. RC27]
MIKTITFAVIHFSIATAVAFVLTGDILIGSMIAMIEPSINTVAFYFHEKVWSRVPALKQRRADTKIKTASFAIIHFSVAFLVTYVITGDAFIGGMMATIEPAINSVAYFFHEKAWLKDNARKRASSISSKIQTLVHA